MANKRRTVLLALLVCTLCSSLAAKNFEYDVSFCTNFIPQCNAYNFTLENDFLFLNDSIVRFGPTLQLGWGLERLNRYGSKAFVYGYSLCTGMKVQFKIIENLYIDTDAKVSIIYAMFPTVLWGEIDTGLSYYITNLIFVRVMTGVLIGKNDKSNSLSTEANFIANISCGVRF